MKRILICCIAVSMLSSCVKSINPLFSEEEFIHDERILGKKIDNHGEIWEFIADIDSTGAVNPKAGFQANYYSKGMKATFWLGVGKIEGQYFAQLFPAEITPIDSTKKNNWQISNYWGHFVPTFSFSKLAFEGDKMVIQTFNSEWIHDQITEGKAQIDYSETLEGVILTATTPKLQQFIAKYMYEERAFDPERIVLQAEN